MKRYQHPFDAAGLPQDELFALFHEDSHDSPDPKGWINELPRTREPATHRRPGCFREKA